MEGQDLRKTSSHQGQMQWRSWKHQAIHEKQSYGASKHVDRGDVPSWDALGKMTRRENEDRTADDRIAHAQSMDGNSHAASDAAEFDLNIHSYP